MLRDQLAQLETLYAELSLGLGFLDADLRFVRVNDKFAAINGSSVEAHLAQPLRAIISKDWADLVEPLYRRVLQTGEPILDYEIPGPSSGAGRFWSISGSPVITDGQVLGLQVVKQDITERKQAEQALHESNASLRRANGDRCRHRRIGHPVQTSRTENTEVSLAAVNQHLSWSVKTWS